MQRRSALTPAQHTLGFRHLYSLIMLSVTTFSQYFVFEQRMTMCLRLSCPLPVIGQLELM